MRSVLFIRSCLLTYSYLIFMYFMHCSSYFWLSIMFDYLSSIIFMEKRIQTTSSSRLKYAAKSSKVCDSLERLERRLKYASMSSKVCQVDFERRCEKHRIITDIKLKQIFFFLARKDKKSYFFRTFLILLFAFQS